MKMGSSGALVGALFVAAFAVACGGDDDGATDMSMVTTGDSSVQSPSGTDSAVPSSTTDGGQPPGSTSPVGSTAGTDAGTISVSTDAGGQARSDAGATTDAGSTTTPTPPATGPANGDPAKPVVAIEGTPCRMASTGGGGLGAGLGSPNAKVGDRDFIVDYPCGKHEGAHMTVILNLHGTLIGGAPWQYQRGYFSAYRYVDSHNLIVVQPHSASARMGGAQWGVEDGGKDLPHLLEVIDWVYKTFDKFQLRALWVGGHSQGSFYTGGFGCNEMIKDRVKGVILMSGARMPACASRLSILNTAAALPMPEGLLNQMANATAHGCDASMMRALDADNDETHWSNCDKGWVHANYLMKTKMHATSMDQSVVKSLVDYIVSVRP